MIFVYFFNSENYCFCIIKFLWVKFVVCVIISCLVNDKEIIEGDVIR